MLAGSPSAQSTPGRRSGRGIPRTASRFACQRAPVRFSRRLTRSLIVPSTKPLPIAWLASKAGGVPQPIPMAREVVQHAPAAAARRSAASGCVQGPLATPRTRRSSRRPPNPAEPSLAMPSTPPLPPTPAGRRPQGVPTRETRPAIAGGEEPRRHQVPDPLPPRRPARSAATRTPTDAPPLAWQRPPNAPQSSMAATTDRTRRGGQFPLLVIVRRRRRTPRRPANTATFTSRQPSGVFTLPASMCNSCSPDAAAKASGNAVRSARPPAAAAASACVIRRSVSASIDQPANSAINRSALRNGSCKPARQGHAAGPHRRPAVHTQQSVGGETNLTAPLTTAMPSDQPDRPDGRPPPPGRTVA